MNLWKFNFLYNAGMVSLWEQPVTKVYASQGGMGIDWAYKVVPERVILMYMVTCEVEKLSNDGAVTWSRWQQQWEIMRWMEL